MKLIRFGLPGHEQPGILTDKGIIALREVFPVIPDIGEVFFRDNWLQRIARIQEPPVQMDVRWGSPINRPSKIICLGKNYKEHAKEGGFEIPEKPLLFCKSSNALNGPFDPIVLPETSAMIDWEVELALVIGKECQRADRKSAFDFIAGYTVMNDVSGREAQFSESQWFRGKSFDTFAPLGPCLVTTDEIPNPDNLTLNAIVNGTVMQKGSTRDLIFDIPFLIEYISRDITLYPGDIISTGTPSGVGIFRNPPIVLKEGDIVECSAEKIGSLRNQVVNKLAYT